MSVSLIWFRLHNMDRTPAEGRASARSCYMYCTVPIASSRAYFYEHTVGVHGSPRLYLKEQTTGVGNN
jgi:hypothetical protein